MLQFQVNQSLIAGEMRGEVAPYSLVPSSETSLLHEKEGEVALDIGIIKSDNLDKKENKRR